MGFPTVKIVFQKLASKQFETFMKGYLIQVVHIFFAMLLVYLPEKLLNLTIKTGNEIPSSLKLMSMSSGPSLGLEFHS